MRWHRCNGLLGDGRLTACVIGTSKIDMHDFDAVARRGAEQSSENAVHQALFPDSVVSKVAGELGCRAGAISPVAACATGLVSIIQGAALIKLQFHPGTDMSRAMAETVSYVNRARAFMPPGTVPPFVMRFDAGSVPVGNPTVVLTLMKPLVQ